MERPDPQASLSRSSTPTLHEAIAIAVGGGLGASLRHAVSLGTRVADPHSVWATTCANLVGALLLGVIAARVDSPQAHPLMRPFLVVGVFGSFTTFSALAFDNRTLAAQHGEAVALLHMTGSIFGGLLAFAGGTAIARGAR